MPTPLPFRHLSVRVPWHEQGWNGTVCPKPINNAACLCLPGIHAARDDGWETDHAGEHVADFTERWPPCVAERAAFMSKRPVAITLTHKLGHDEWWKHLQPTRLDLPAYSAPALPFRWMNRDGAAALAQIYPTGYDAEREPRERWMDTSNWILDPGNQQRCLNAFWSAIRPEKSLCLFYAKAIPGVETQERVLIGIGRIKEVTPPRRYIKGEKDGYDAWMWECPVTHSIRPGFQDGFVLPYHALLAKCASNPELVFSDYVAFAPEEHRDEFSYVSELVTPDGALRALESCRVAIERARKVVEGPWEGVLRWINDRCSEVQRQRGAYPGLGAALSAIGISQGMVVAAELTRDQPVESDPWARVAQAFADPKILPAELRGQITPSLQAKFKLLQRPDRAKRMEFLRLLSRFALGADQMRLLWDEEQRRQAGIEAKESDFLANPYLVYEERRRPAVLTVRHQTEASEDAGEEGEEEKRVVAPASFWTVDRGVFLPTAFAASHPLPKEGQMTGADDVRRVRSLLVHLLHRAEGEGHSLLPLSMAAQRGSEMTLEPPCPLDVDLIQAVQDELEDRLFFPEFAESQPACQLVERDEICTAIRNLVRRARLKARLAVAVNWRELIDQDQQLGKIVGSKDEKARAEKAAALEEIAQSCFSVLIGPAGTGKTTLLRALCNEPSIKNGGVLLLAPTGKARVRLQTSVKLPALTLAQYLRRFGRFEPATGTYRLRSHADTEKQFKTVVVDESSMLTEDQLAALAETVGGAERIILVGDPAQLPPIGVGRPFVDIVKALEPETSAGWPRVARGYAELTMRMRQDADGDDLALAELFGGRPSRAGDDEILFELVTQPDRPRVRCVRWEAADDLRDRLREVLTGEFAPGGGMEDLCESLGADAGAKGHWYFNLGAEEFIESWQMIAPVRLLAGGTEDLNRLLQQELRGSMLEFASGKQSASFRVPRPVGPQQVVYGDKVINVSNQWNHYVKPREDAKGEKPLRYIANGEIGVVIGEKFCGEPHRPWLPKHLHVAFGSQPGFRYSFTAQAFKEEGDATLELAYAITVHKAQGSEFGKVILVIPEHASTLSRELLYTALTRHKEKLIIFHQGHVIDLIRFAAADACETARRFTIINGEDANPKRRPLPVAITDRQTGRKTFYESSLIHKTRAGQLVRSKSEVIIASELDFARERRKLTYEYEVALDDPEGGPPRYPDFTVRDESIGRVWYWEHRGMLSNKKYRERWEKKARWYQRVGIKEWDAEQNPDGQLILTEDGPDGDIDATRAKEIVRRLTA